MAKIWIMILDLDPFLEVDTKDGLSTTSAPMFAVERSTNDQETALLNVFVKAVETQRTLEKMPP